MRKESFYDKKLTAYYDCHYKNVDHEVEWYVNPAINQWKFCLRGIIVTLICDEEGIVNEKYGHENR